MSRLLVLLQILSIGLLIWAGLLGFSVLAGKAAPSAHMYLALTAALVSILTHAAAALWFPKRLRR